MRVSVVIAPIVRESFIDECLASGKQRAAECGAEVIVAGYGPADYERLVWGRSYAATRCPRGCEQTSLPGSILSRPARAGDCPHDTHGLSEAARLRRSSQSFAAHDSAHPVSWSCGELMGYLTGRANAAGTPVAEAPARAAAQ